MGHHRLRAQGLGRRLVEAAEAEAEARGCRTVVVSSHSFQAPAMYRRLGYAEIGAADDAPIGARHFYFQKVLCEELRRTPRAVYSVNAKVLDDTIAELGVARDFQRTTRTRFVAGPTPTGQTSEGTAVHGEARRRVRGNFGNSAARPSTPTVATSGVSPVTVKTIVEPWAARRPSCRRRTASAFGGMRPSGKIRDRTFEQAGPFERFADVLVVVPAVEDADLHELPVRARAFGREALLVPLLRRAGR